MLFNLTKIKKNNMTDKQHTKHFFVTVPEISWFYCKTNECKEDASKDTRRLVCKANCKLQSKKKTSKKVGRTTFTLSKTSLRVGLLAIRSIAGYSNNMIRVQKVPRLGCYWVGHWVAIHIFGCAWGSLHLFQVEWSVRSFARVSN